MSLRLGAKHTDRMHVHLARAYPEEGCGVLLGRERGSVREVERVVCFENQREDSRANRYLISPEQFLAAESEARAAGLEVLGFFHSHPDHPARPSAFDLEHAWPYYSYLIVSVCEGQVAEVGSFLLSDDRGRFDSEPLEILPAGPPAASGDER